jgi:prephenate dehydrogenase
VRPAVGAEAGEDVRGDRRRIPEPADAVRGSQLVVLATPVLAIVDLIGRLGPALPASTLLTDVGSTKAAVAQQALKVFGKNARHRFLAGHPMAGKENSGVDYADADCSRMRFGFLTPLPGQNLHEAVIRGICGMDRSDWGAGCDAAAGGSRPAVCVDQPCAADDFNGAGGGAGGGVWRRGAVAAGGRAGAAGDDADFGESVFDVAGYCDQQQEESGDALWKVEQRLAHIRENLATRQLAEEFELAHGLRKNPGKKE